MNQQLAGPGVNLPIPTNLYPSELNSVPYDFATNQVCLAPGENLVIPAGDFMVSMGGYLVFQYKDPITGIWTFAPGAAYDRGLQFVTSDGQNLRVANLTGCPVLGIITSVGATYVQASTTITVTGGGGSTWAPIIGGALAFTGGSVASVGGGYGIAPIMLIPAPPNYQINPNGIGGVPASGYVGIAGGTCVLTGVTFTNPGAGYAAAPANFALLPTPSDPNLAIGITLATVGFSLTSASLLMAALCTNNGAPLAAIGGITLTVNGVGVTGSVSVAVMQTITAATVGTAGVGYATTGNPVIVTGGGPPTGTIANNPDGLLLRWFPRQPNIDLSAAASSMSVGTPAVIYDGGLFLSAPVATAFPTSPSATSSVAALTLVMGSRPDIAWIQPAP